MDKSNLELLSLTHLNTWMFVCYLCSPKRHDFYIVILTSLQGVRKLYGFLVPKVL